ncbi:Smr/MutS family protein [Croceibacterium aestuarii]|uniref:Smr/MutS family protein n=1 Tax=Croceibacterium aestuarii TaxID=3064139 RepID=UPI00272E2C3B|nr:Smr/MutS family protein [Croceibacterium sp. D39]
MKPPRGLTAEESAAWARLAATVRPLDPPRHEVGGGGASPPAPAAPAAPAPRPPKGRIPPPRPVPLAAPAPRDPSQPLDSTWDRKLARGTLAPDFTLDLHGHTLEGAHRRLDDGLLQAKAMGARVVLLITGKPRPVAAADRAERRGAIRAKVLDWLAAGPHGSDIAAVRTAHRRHGGEGALYLVLRKRR